VGANLPMLPDTGRLSEHGVQQRRSKCYGVRRPDARTGAADVPRRSVAKRLPKSRRCWTATPV
jgi:hypothetical protein